MSMSPLSLSPQGMGPGHHPTPQPKLQGHSKAGPVTLTCQSGDLEGVIWALAAFWLQMFVILQLRFRSQITTEACQSSGPCSSPRARAQAEEDTQGSLSWYNQGSDPAAINKCDVCKGELFHGKVWNQSAIAPQQQQQQEEEAHTAALDLPHTQCIPCPGDAQPGLDS